MGDITKPQYAMRRQMMDEELQRAKPPTDPDLDRAQAILEDFARFWDAEPNPAERRKLILSLFAQVWAKDNQIVAVKPNPAFANYFTAASEVRATHPKADAGDEATNTGATGVAPSFVTPYALSKSGFSIAFRSSNRLRQSLVRVRRTMLNAIGRMLCHEGVRAG